MKGVFAALVVSGTALAQPQSAKSRADELFREGNALLAQGKIAEACASFDASQAVDPSLSNRLHQANCREKNGQLATASALYQGVAADTVAAADDFAKQLHSIAEGKAQAIQARVSTLEVDVPAALSGMEIRLDDSVLPLTRWNVRFAIDGGRHRLSAAAPGHAPWAAEVIVAAEHDAKTIAVPALVEGGAAQAATGRRSADEDSGGGIATDWTGHALVGGGVVLAAVGSFVLVSARRTVGDHNLQSSYGAFVKDQSDAESARHREPYAVAAIAVGGAAIVGGVVHYLLRGRRHEPVVSASVEPGAASVSLGGSF